MILNIVQSMFYMDSLSIVMMALVGFVGISVAFFASRYLKGDRHYRRFFILLALLIASVFTMVNADHIALLLGAWGTSNLLLVLLMVHKNN